MTHRGVHRHGQPAAPESIHAAAAAAATERAKAVEAKRRQVEAETFLAEWRHAFGLNGGTGAHR